MIATKKKRKGKKKAAEIWVGGRFELQKSAGIRSFPFLAPFFPLPVSVRTRALARSLARPSSSLSLPPPSLLSLATPSLLFCWCWATRAATGSFVFIWCVVGEYSGCCVLVGWFVGCRDSFGFRSHLRACLFFGGGGEGEGGGVDLCFVLFCWFLSGHVRMMSMVEVKEDPGLVPLYSLLGEDSGGVGGKCIVVIV